MPLGTTLLQSIQLKRHDRDAERQSELIAVLQSHGIPTPDSVTGGDDDGSFSRTTSAAAYDIAFNFYPESGKLDPFAITIPDDLLYCEDFTHGRLHLRELMVSELKDLMPEAGELELTILSWLRFTDEAVRPIEDLKKSHKTDRRKSFEERYAGILSSEVAR